jgi:hypothetical protein
MTKSNAAYLFSTERLGQQSLFMWTFTFKEALDVKATRAKWNHLLTLMRRTWPNLAGLRVFEMHKSHGLHVHLVTNRFIDVNVALTLAKKAGWGRIHVQRIPVERAGYLAKYLSKQRPECLKRWRLWAGFGTWEWTKVRDIVFDSAFSRIYKACKDWLAWKGNRNFSQRMSLVQLLERRTVEEGWLDGFGSFNKPYWMCCREELFGITLTGEHPF